MGRPNGQKDAKRRTRRTKEEMRMHRETLSANISKYGSELLMKKQQLDERDCIIAEVILRRRELEFRELEALMQVAPNGVTPTQIQRQYNAIERWILDNEPAVGAQEVIGTLQWHHELKSYARHSVGAIIYDDEE